jgi:hypothetical protein
MLQMHPLALRNFEYREWFEIIVEVSVAYNFQTGNNEITLLKEYESVTQKVLFGNAVFIL